MNKNSRMIIMIETELKEGIKKVSDHFAIKQPDLLRMIVSKEINRILGIGLSNLKLEIKDNKFSGEKNDKD